MYHHLCFLVAAALTVYSPVAQAQEEDIDPVDCCHVTTLTATPSSSSTEAAGGGGSWVFAAEMSSPYEIETGWDKYCDAFEIRSNDVDGEALSLRVLGHPHPNEQPFSRRTTVVVPPGVDTVVAIARDSVVGFCGSTVTMELGIATTDVIVATREPTEPPESSVIVETLVPTASLSGNDTDLGNDDEETTLTPVPTDVNAGQAPSLTPSPTLEGTNPDVAPPSSAVTRLSKLWILGLVMTFIGRYSR